MKEQLIKHIVLIVLIMSVQSIAATYTANSSATLVTAINNANSNAGLDTIEVSGNFTMSDDIPDIEDKVIIKSDMPGIKRTIDCDSLKYSGIRINKNDANNSSIIDICIINCDKSSFTVNGDAGIKGVSFINCYAGLSGDGTTSGVAGQDGFYFKDCDSILVIICISAGNSDNGLNCNNSTITGCIVGYKADGATTAEDTDYAFRIRESDGNTISDCKLYDEDNSIEAVVFLRESDNNVIERNKISGEGGANKYGVQLDDYINTGNVIQNNYFYNVGNGIYSEAGNATVSIYFNSFFTTSSCITGDFTDFNIQNNIFYTASGSSSSYCVNIEAGTPSAMDYNCYYYPGNAKCVRYNNTDYNILADWQNTFTSNDVNSIDDNLDYMNARNGDLFFNIGSSVDNVGISLASSVTVDINGVNITGGTYTVQVTDDDTPQGRGSLTFTITDPGISLSTTKINGNGGIFNQYFKNKQTC